jgi:hypothetical protein
MYRSIRTKDIYNHWVQYHQYYFCLAILGSKNMAYYFSVISVKPLCMLSANKNISCCNQHAGF